ncbi:MAG: linear amide C-N hydrolase, partial [Coriobacteriaceae bacterium]|nr:linear amide C-N hydrolase [Coriobacteriaceae bacterium]
MCSGIRFTDKAGNMFFGRNLDWSFSYGERVVITPANYQLPSPFGAMPQTRFPLIGMGITAQGIPLYFDCANDQGLAVAGLNFPGFAAYEPQAVEGKTNIAAYEFPLWVAGLFASVDEVEANLADVAIVGKAPIEQLGVAQLHWIIADAQRSIVVEYTEAGLQVFHDDVDVLTNQ